MKTNKNLSSAQIKMLRNVANQATAAYPENTAKSLAKRGLIYIPLYRYDGVGYKITMAGRGVLSEMDKPAHYTPTASDSRLTEEIRRYNQLALKR